MYVRVIQDDWSPAIFHVWAGLEQGSRDIPLWSDRDFIDQPYSFIIGTGASRELALGDARVKFAGAMDHVPAPLDDKALCHIKDIEDVLVYTHWPFQQI